MSVPVPRYTQTPNVLFDEHMQDMKLAELKVTLAIVRKILGWHKERPEAISYSQLQKLTGLSRSNVTNGVQDAIRRGTIKIAGKGRRGVNLYTLNFTTSPGTGIDDGSTSPGTGLTKETHKELKKKDSPVSEKKPDTGDADGSKTDSSKTEDTTSLKQKDVGTVKRETIPLRVLLKETRAKLNVHEPERPFGEREAEKIAAYNDSLKLKDVPPAVPMQYEICEQCLRRREIVAIIDDVPLCNECAAQVQNESVANDTDSRTREKPKRKRSEKQQKQDRVVDALVETFEYTKPTKSDYSNLRGVAKELLEVGLTHEDIPALVQYVRQKESKGDWTVTARSLIGNGRVGRYIRWRDADKTKPIGTPAYSPNDSEIWSGGGDDAGK